MPKAMTKRELIKLAKGMCGYLDMCDRMEVPKSIRLHTIRKDLDVVVDGTKKKTQCSRYSRMYKKKRGVKTCAEK